MRDPKLQTLIDEAFALLDRTDLSGEARDLVKEAGLQLSTIEASRSEAVAQRLPVCEAWLNTAIGAARAHDPGADALLTAFEAFEPNLAWHKRQSGTAVADSFLEGHANALVVGPKGYEDRDDVWLGVTLMAPGVEYPLHRHPPRELYLALSEGTWSRDRGPWHSPGILGTFYNPSNALHTMRASAKPLLTFWLLAR